MKPAHFELVVFWWCNRQAYLRFCYRSRLRISLFVIWNVVYFGYGKFNTKIHPFSADVASFHTKIWVKVQQSRLSILGSGFFVSRSVVSICWCWVSQTAECRFYLQTHIWRFRFQISRVNDSQVPLLCVNSGCGLFFAMFTTKSAR